MKQNGSVVRSRSKRTSEKTNERRTEQSLMRFGWRHLSLKTGRRMSAVLVSESVVLRQPVVWVEAREMGEKKRRKRAEMRRRRRRAEKPLNTKHERGSAQRRNKM